MTGSLDLLHDVQRRAMAYVEQAPQRRVYPGADALRVLRRLVLARTDDDVDGSMRTIAAAIGVARAERGASPASRVEEAGR